MKTFRFFELFLFVLFIICTTCSTECSEFIPTYGDSSGTIEVGVGQRFSIALKSNPTTGYKWEFAKQLDTNILRFVGSGYKPSAPGLIGGGGKEIWTFEAIREGQTMISFKYSRPWERDMYPLKSQTFIVIVGPARPTKPPLKRWINY